MLKLRYFILLLAVFLLLPFHQAQSATISLDDMDTNTYFTPYGTITFSGGEIYEGGGAFQHDGAYMPSDYAEFHFNFDVDAIDFISSSLSGGIYTVAYDINNNEVASYHTLDFIINHPVSLAGSGIRRLIFADGRLPTMGAGGWVDAADILLTTSAPIVPEPVSSTLFIIGGATLGFRRLRKKFKK